MVLSYVQLLPERDLFPLVGSGIHMHTFQSGSTGLKALRLLRFYESGQIFLCPAASFERRAILEVYAGCGSGYIRPVYFFRRRGSIGSTEGNGYFSRFYIAATKHLPIGTEEIGVHLSYLYNQRKEYKLNGIAAGITYNPSFAPDLRVIAEYDSKDFALGATYLLFNHLHLQVELQRMQYFTGGLMFRFNLK